MLRRWILSLILFAGLAVPLTRAEDLTRRKVRFLRLPAAEAPADLARPEGKTRWDLAKPQGQEAFTRSLLVSQDRVTVVEEAAGQNPLSRTRAYRDASGGSAA